MQPLSAPIPLQATLTLTTGTLTVDFDKLLVSQPTAGNSWFAWDGLNRHQNLAGAGSAFMRRVTIVLPNIVPQVKAQSCRYANLLGDVVGRNGLLVQAFDDFPLTVV